MINHPYYPNSMMSYVFTGERIFMHSDEIYKVQNFLNAKFSGTDIKLKPREETDDSVEFIIDGETLGIVFKDDEDGDICYHVQMTILSEDIG